MNDYYPFTYQAMASIQPQTQNGFWGYVKDEGIYINESGNMRHVGMTLQAFQDLEAITNQYKEMAEKYKARLIELGDLIIPPTQEEINAQLLAELKAERELREKAMNFIANMEANNGYKESSIGSSEPATVVGEAKSRKVGASDKRSDSQG